MSDLCIGTGAIGVSAAAALVDWRAGVAVFGLSLFAFGWRLGA